MTSAMRRLSADDVADLQTLARAFCNAAHIRFKQLENEAGSEALDAKTQDSVSESIHNFLSHFNKSVVARADRDARHLVSAISRISENIQMPRAREIQGLVELLIADANYRKTDRWLAFAAEAEPFKTQERRNWDKKRTSASRPSTAHDDGPSKSLRVAFSQFAQDLAYLDRDINLSDRRIDRSENGSKNALASHGDSEVGNAFVIIRKSSRTKHTFVVHGLSVAPHINSSTLLYSSEKYPLTGGKRRKSQGICFFDGRYLVAIARARTDSCFTFITGLMGPNDDHLDVFEAIIATTNGKEQRISAKALCLRCSDRPDQRSKIGVFPVRQLVSKYVDEQKRMLEAWIAASAEPVLIL